MATSRPSAPPAARRIERTYYGLTALNMFALTHIVGINTLFMIERGLTTAEWNYANAAYAIAMVVFEIPTGVVADTVGRRTSFLLSIVVLFLGSLGTLLYAHDLFTFSAFGVLFGLGYTFASGAVEAWVVDALKASDFEGSFDRMFSRAGVARAGAMLLGTTSGAALGSLSLDYPWMVRCAVLVPLFGYVWLRMHDVGYEPRPLTARNLFPEIRRTALAGVTHGLSNRAIRRLMLAELAFGAFFLFGWYSWQPYLIQDLGVVTFGGELIWLAGVISALLLAAEMLGHGLAPRALHHVERRSRVLALCAFASAALVLIGGGVPAWVTPGAPHNFYLALGAFLLTMALHGVGQPLRQGLINGLIEADERATVLSVDSLVTNVGTSIGVIALGSYAQRVTDDGGLGIGQAWGVGALFILIGVPILWSAGRLAGDKDHVLGDA
jgi:MFS family permease